MGLQLGEGFLELLGRLLGETVEFDVADVVVEHIGRIDAVQRYLVASNLKVDQFGIVASLHADGDLGAFLAAKVFLHVFVVDLLAKAFLAVNLDE